MRCSRPTTAARCCGLAATQEVHLILLDVMMPGMDGLSAMAELRQDLECAGHPADSKSEDTDKVLGLNLGADDYVTKPFNPIEVMARVRSQLRRYLQLGGGQVLPTQVTIGGIMLDDAGRTVTVDGEPVALTPTESTSCVCSCSMRAQSSLRAKFIAVSGAIRRRRGERRGGAHPASALEDRD